MDNNQIKPTTITAVKCCNTQCNKLIDAEQGYYIHVASIAVTEHPKPTIRPQDRKYQKFMNTTMSNLCYCNLECFAKHLEIKRDEAHL